MNGTLAQAMINQIAAGLGSGQVNVQVQHFAVEPNAGDPLTDEARQTATTERFDFDPEGSREFHLSHPPYGRERRVWLLATDGGEVALPEAELAWQGQTLQLRLAAERDVTDVVEVVVSYSYLAHFAHLWLAQTLVIELSETSPSEADSLDRTQALVMAILEVEKEKVLEEARSAFAQGDYAVAITPRCLTLLSGSAPTPDRRTLTYRVESDYRCSRSLAPGEGVTIGRIVSPNGEDARQALRQRDGQKEGIAVALTIPRRPANERGDL